MIIHNNFVEDWRQLPVCAGLRENKLQVHGELRTLRIPSRIPTGKPCFFVRHSQSVSAASADGMPQPDYHFTADPSREEAGHVEDVIKKLRQGMPGAPPVADVFQIRAVSSMPSPAWS